MKRPQSGFAVPEVILLGAVLAVVLTASVMVWRRHQNSVAHTSTPSGQSGWQLYKSAHSTVSFSYPSSWKLAQGTVSGYTLEHVELQGPHHFQMSYQLETDHLDTGRSCARAAFGAAIALKGWQIIPTLNTNDNTQVLSVSLVDSADATKSGCPLSMYHNAVSDTMGFTFSGGYTATDGQYAARLASTYFSQPEVQTAKAIFATLKK